MEPDNELDKCTACVKKENVVAGHLPLVKNRKFVKIIFYFLCADRCATSKVVITSKSTNLGDGDAMQLPLDLRIAGKNNSTVILEKKL